jgi:hypothetical protein
MNQLFSLAGLLISAMYPIPDNGSGLFLRHNKKDGFDLEGAVFSYHIKPKT